LGENGLADTAQSRPTWRYYLALPLAALAGIVALALAGEGLARILFPTLTPTREERAKFWRYDPLLGWANQPNSSGQFNHVDFSVSVTHNADGLRDRDYPLERTEKKRMLLIGDSFTWGFGVEADETFGELLEAAHPDWEIINAGVSGYSTDQQYLYLRERGMRYKPDVVVALVFYDGLAGNVQDQAYLWNKPSFSIANGRLEMQQSVVPQVSWQTRFLREAMHGSYLGKMAFQVWRSYGPGHEMQYSVDGTNQFGVTEDAKFMTIMLLAEMSQLCNQHGAQLVVLGQKIETVLLERIQREGKRKGFTIYPVDPFFNGDSAPYYFPHDAHWNARGHRKVAATIDAYFGGLQIWKPAGGFPPPE